MLCTHEQALGQNNTGKISLDKAHVQMNMEKITAMISQGNDKVDKPAHSAR